MDEEEASIGEELVSEDDIMPLANEYGNPIKMLEQMELLVEVKDVEVFF